MSIGVVVQEQKEQMRRSRDQALGEGKSLEEANSIAEKAGEEFAARTVTGLTRAASYGLAGAAVGSAVPVFGTAIGGTVGIAVGVISAAVEPNPSIGKAVGTYASLLKKIFGAF